MKKYIGVCLLAVTCMVLLLLASCDNKKGKNDMNDHFFNGYVMDDTKILESTLTKEYDLNELRSFFKNSNANESIGFGSTEYIGIRANTSLVYPEWIFYHINTPEFIDGGKSFMTGTAGQQRVDINYVKQYRIPVPSLEEQKKILDQIRYEQSLIEPSKQLIKVFTQKIETRIKEVWGE